MKVLGVVITHPLRIITGAINAAYQLSEAIGKEMPYTLAMMVDRNEHFKKNGLEIIKFKANNVLSPIIKILPRFVYVPFYKSCIPSFISKGKYDLVHIHNPIPTFAMKDIANACIKKGVPYCVSSHGFMEITDYGNIMKYGIIKKYLVNIAITNPFMFVIKNASWIFTLSPLDEEILKKLDFPKSQSSCVTNGVKEYLLHEPLDSELKSLKNKIKLFDDKNPKLLFMGSLYPYKGVDTFLSLLHYISYPVTAIIGGKLKSVTEKQNLLKSINVSLIDRHNIIFTDWLTDTELRSLYHLADVFVYPTRGDTLPLCILEAMACRLPIVASSVGGIPFQLDNGAGFLVEPDQPEATANLVKMLIENKELRERTGYAARKRVDEVFNWNRSSLQAIDGYKRILDYKII